LNIPVFLAIFAMPATKRKRSYNRHIDGLKLQPISLRTTLPRRRVRNSTTSTPSRLETLPAEILEDIFWRALEPALLHTCRRIWHLTKRTTWVREPVLPTYQAFTRSLAGLAMCGKERNMPDARHGKGETIRDFIMSRYLIARAGLEMSRPKKAEDYIGIKEELRKEVQRVVFTSRWFGARQFDATHVELFAGAVNSTSPVDLEGFICTAGQEKKIDRFLDNTTSMQNRPSLKMRFRRVSAEAVSYEVTPTRIEMTTRTMGEIWSWEILDFHYIPSELLRPPITSAKKHILINIIVRSRPESLDNKMHFDGSLFNPAIQHILEDHSDRDQGVELLDSLLIMEDRFREEGVIWVDEAEAFRPPTILHSSHFRTAAITGRVKCLTSLLYHSPPFNVANESVLRELQREVTTLKTPNHETVISLISSFVDVCGFRAEGDCHCSCCERLRS
jgi:hypothetical protein